MAWNERTRLEPKPTLPPAKEHINPLEAATVVVNRADSSGLAASINALTVADARPEPKIQKQLHVSDAATYVPTQQRSLIEFP